MTDGAGRARTLLDRQLSAEPHDFLVRASERQMQKTERIEQRLRCLPEGLEHDLLGHFRSARAVGVPAHAIHDHEQRGMFRNRGRDPVLILLARAEEADIGVLDPQEDVCASVRLDASFISPPAGERSYHRAVHALRSRSPDIDRSRA